MKQSANPVQMLQFITQPAFLVKDGVITQVNTAATNYKISVGATILDMIASGREEYESFSSGKLYLTLHAGRAWVSVCDGVHLFCLENAFASPELRAFALAAQHLRAPLSNAVFGTEAIMQRDDLVSEGLKEQLSQINRSLYQMIRTVCNMSDVSQLGTSGNANIQQCNARYVFSEVFEKASALAENTGHPFRFRGLKQNVECALDSQLIERAVLNMLSNALKFSPSGSEILAVLKYSENRLSLTIENKTHVGSSTSYRNAFHRFLREPGIDSSQAGIGLGMSIISQAAAIHSGTLLLNISRNGVVRVTLSIPTTIKSISAAKSPVILLDGYTGGIDNYLVELSDVLPNHLYDNI